MIPPSLDYLFHVQDIFAKENRDAMSKQYSLLNEALLLMVITIGALNSKPILDRRRRKLGHDSVVESIQVNLAYTTWSTLINMCRLLTFGSFVNVISLYRNALESLSFYWYLRREPSDVSRWVDVLANGLLPSEDEDSTTFDDQRKAFEKFRRKVKKRFDRENKPTVDYGNLSLVLSTYGTHTNPYSMAGSLPSQLRNQNLGFLSVGDGENLQCLAHDILHLVMFFLEELFGQFGSTIPKSFPYQDRVTIKNERENEVYIYQTVHLALPGRYSQLKRRFRGYNSTFTGKLKLFGPPPREKSCIKDFTVDN